MSTRTPPFQLQARYTRNGAWVPCPARTIPETGRYATLQEAQDALSRLAKNAWEYRVTVDPEDVSRVLQEAANDLNEESREREASKGRGPKDPSPSEPDIPFGFETLDRSHED